MVMVFIGCYIKVHFMLILEQAAKTMMKAVVWCYMSAMPTLNLLYPINSQVIAHETILIKFTKQNFL